MNIPYTVNINLHSEYTLHREYILKSEYTQHSEYTLHSEYILHSKYTLLTVNIYYTVVLGLRFHFYNRLSVTIALPHSIRHRLYNRFIQYIVFNKPQCSQCFLLFMFDKKYTGLMFCLC